MGGGPSIPGLPVNIWAVGEGPRSLSMNSIPLLPFAILIVVLLGLALLRFNGQRPQPTVLLGLILTVVAAVLLMRIGASNGATWATYLRVFVIPGVALTGPLLYLYTRSSLFSESAKDLSRTVRLGILVPVGVFLVMGAMTLFLPWMRDPALMFSREGIPGIQLRVLMYGLPAYILLYVVRAWLLLCEYRRKYEDTLAVSDVSLEIRWLKIFLLLSTLWHLAPPIVIALSDLTTVVKPSNPVLEVPVALMIYLVIQHAMNNPQRVGTSLAEPERAERNVPIAVDPQRLRQIGKQVRALFEDDEAFLDDKVSVDSTAQALNVPAYLVSHAIAAEFGRNFYGAVNGFRVQRASELLRDPDMQQETILNVAFRAGFQSKAAFNRVFKSVTGRTPRQFRSEALASAPH